MQPHFDKELVRAVSASPVEYSNAQLSKFIDQLRYPKPVLDVKGLQAFGNVPTFYKSLVFH